MQEGFQEGLQLNMLKCLGGFSVIGSEGFNWILGIDCHQHKKLNGIALLIFSHGRDDKLPNIVSVTRQLMTLRTAMQK